MLFEGAGHTAPVPEGVQMEAEGKELPYIQEGLGWVLTVSGLHRIEACPE